MSDDLPAVPQQGGEPGLGGFDLGSMMQMAADMHSIPLFQLPDFAAADRAYSPVSYIGFGGGPLWNAFAWTKS